MISDSQRPRNPRVEMDIGMKQVMLNELKDKYDETHVEFQVNLLAGAENGFMYSCMWM